MKRLRKKKRNKGPFLIVTTVKENLVVIGFFRESTLLSAWTGFASEARYFNTQATAIECIQTFLTPDSNYVDKVVSLQEAKKLSYHNGIILDWPK